MNKFKETILIVDDQTENLAILGDLLAPFYRVRVADSGPRALRAVLTEPKPDLIMLDVMMPDINGYEVLARLKANPETSEIPVIFVTSKDSVEDEEHGLEIGAVDYILKPVKPLVVLARVHTHLENRKAREWLKNQNKYLEMEVERRMHDNEIVQGASLAALSILAETRDNETGNHIYRTQSYTEVLAKALQSHSGYRDQLPPQQLAMIVKAAPLHDIGKVGIPDHILLKPDFLNEEELNIMRTHTRIGGEAIAKAMQRVHDTDNSIYRRDLTPLTFLEVARQIALWHHERWDGAGYPDRLRGEDIPLAARIMALADVFDALISRRVYKSSLQIAEACEIIIAGNGTQFDPVVVEAFIEVKAEFGKIAWRFADN